MEVTFYQAPYKDPSLFPLLARGTLQSVFLWFRFSQIHEGYHPTPAVCLCSAFVGRSGSSSRLVCFLSFIQFPHMFLFTCLFSLFHQVSTCLFCFLLFHLVSTRVFFLLEFSPWSFCRVFFLLGVVVSLVPDFWCHHAARIAFSPHPVSETQPRTGMNGASEALRPLASKCGWGL